MTCQVTQLVNSHSECSVVSVRTFKKGPLISAPHLSIGHGREEGVREERVSGTNLLRGQYSKFTGSYEFVAQVCIGEGFSVDLFLCTKAFSSLLLPFPLPYLGFLSLLEGPHLTATVYTVNWDTVGGSLGPNPGLLAIRSCQSHFIALSLSLHICKRGNICLMMQW